MSSSPGTQLVVGNLTTDRQGWSCRKGPKANLHPVSLLLYSPFGQETLVHIRQGILVLALAVLPLAVIQQYGWCKLTLYSKMTPLQMENSLPSVRVLSTVDKRSQTIREEGKSTAISGKLRMQALLGAGGIRTSFILEAIGRRPCQPANKICRSQIR